MSALNYLTIYNAKTETHFFKRNYFP